MSDAAAASSSRPGSPEVVLTRRFGDLRGVQWRIDLGVLPSPPSASVDELRRVTADSRRRYATLRRRLLVDPHISKDGNNSSNLVMDNPLSQNPESSWGRFFRNAELEKMVDQDLLRLYPEDGSYFQTPGCQGMLRRILLLWCLRHPKCGYRQGMHELLAPLVYVLQVDINCLSQVRKLYEEHFTDKFDELSVHESDLTYNFDYKRFSNNMDSPKSPHGSIVKARSIDDLDPDVQKFILLSDAYGAEGELGILLSEKFMEHDAYSMFEALMTGVNGSVAMADFFSHSPVDASNNSLPPVIEASSALYHLLSIVDSSLYSHLIELGVEPQYFALRWLRVLFGREFNLQDLLIIWDEIFMQDNCKISTGAEDSESSFGVFSSARGAFIAALSVSMMLYLRSSLLAAEISTSALQRLLNFPQNVDLKKLIGKAKSLQILALDATSGFMSSSSSIGAFDQRKSKIVRAQSLSSDSVSPKSPLNLVPDSYWEERWRVLHKEEELKQGSSEKQVTSIKRKGWSEKVNVGLSRTESDPSPAKSMNQKKIPRSTVRRSLLEDLSRQLGSDEGIEEISGKEHSNDRDSTAMEDERCSGRDAGSDENSSVSSDSASPHCASIGLEVDSEKSSDDHEDQFQPMTEDSPLPVSDIPEESSLRMVSDDAGSTRNVGTDGEQKPLMGKFQWLWKFGRSSPPESSSERRGSIETPESIHSESCHPTEATIVDGSHNCETSVGCKGDAADLNVMGTLKNIGQSMLEHIQVIESAFQQDRGQVGSLESFSKNVLVGKGQVTAMAALKELRKISNLLSEM